MAISTRNKSARRNPLVKKLLGGKGEDGARLTEAGERAITVFYEIEKRIKDFAQQEFQNIKFIFFTYQYSLKHK